MFSATRDNSSSPDRRGGSGGVIRGDHDGDGNDAGVRSHEEIMREMMDMMGDPSLGPVVQSALKGFEDTVQSRGLADTVLAEVERERMEVEEKLEDERQRLRLKGKNADVFRPEDDFDKFEDPHIGGALRMIAGTQDDLGMADMTPSAVESEGEETMRRMIEEFEALGKRSDYDEVIDNMMRQLLAKEVMYDPIVKICGRFPKWLAENKKTLSEKQYGDYGSLYQCLQHMQSVYDAEPDNFPRLMELMFDIQQYGMVPQGIIEELAPGLKFDASGFPIMVNMGAGVYPDNSDPMHPEGAEKVHPIDSQALPEMMKSGQCVVS